MLELTKAEDLTKAATSIASFFAKQAADLEKSHSFHTKMAAHHSAMAGHHDGLAKAHQAAHAAMDDDHELKNCMGKAAGHHADLHKEHSAAAATHTAQAEMHKAAVDALKTLASDWGGPTVKAADGTPISSPSAGGGIASMLQETQNALLKKTLESFDTDPEVKDFVRKFALQQMAEGLGSKIVPDHVRGIITQFPNNTLVPRAGAPAPSEKADVPLEFEKMVSVDD